MEDTEVEDEIAVVGAGIELATEVLLLGGSALLRVVDVCVDTVKLEFWLSVVLEIGTDAAEEGRYCDVYCVGT